MSDRTNRIKSQVTTQVSKATTQVKTSPMQRLHVLRVPVRLPLPIGTPDNLLTKYSPWPMSLHFAVSFLRLSFSIFCTHGNRWIALTCYVVAAVTDFLDGQ